MCAAPRSGSVVFRSCFVRCGFVSCCLVDADCLTDVATQMPVDWLLKPSDCKIGLAAQQPGGEQWALPNKSPYRPADLPRMTIPQPLTTQGPCAYTVRAAHGETVSMTSVDSSGPLKYHRIPRDARSDSYVTMQKPSSHAGPRCIRPAGSASVSTPGPTGVPNHSERVTRDYFESNKLTNSNGAVSEDRTPIPIKNQEHERSQEPCAQAETPGVVVSCTRQVTEEEVTEICKDKPFRSSRARVISRDPPLGRQVVPTPARNPVAR